MIENKALIWVDYLIIVIIVLSGLISLVRGFIGEVFSLAAWILAVWVALEFSSQGAALLAGVVSASPSLQIAIAFLVLLLGTLILAAMINYLVHQLVEKTGLTGTDRALGVIFGVTRGAAIVTLLVLLAGMTPIPQDPWWQDSLLLGHFQELALWVRNWMPADIAAYVQF